MRYVFSNFFVNFINAQCCFSPRPAGSVSFAHMLNQVMLDNFLFWDPYIQRRLVECWYSDGEKWILPCTLEVDL
jgi:hypothetical protein